MCNNSKLQRTKVSFSQDQTYYFTLKNLTNKV